MMVYGVGGPKFGRILEKVDFVPEDTALKFDNCCLYSVDGSARYVARGSFFDV
jgi:hypothetical protein